MTHAEEIMQAIKTLVGQEKRVFSRKDVRDQIGVDHDTWMAGYTAIFQGMRVDQPGGAPKVESRFKGVLERVERGQYRLTDRGKLLISNISAYSRIVKQLPEDLEINLNQHFDWYSGMVRETVTNNQNLLDQLETIPQKILGHIGQLDDKLYQRTPNLLLAMRLTECIRIFDWIKVCLLCGAYESIYRELRFMLESMIQAFHIDMNHFDSPLETKLEVFKALCTRRDFQGSRLINDTDNLPNKKDLRTMFGDLSSYVHPSYKAWKPYLDLELSELLENIYNEELAQDCVEKSLQVCELVIVINSEFQRELLKPSKFHGYTAQ